MLTCSTVMNAKTLAETDENKEKDTAEALVNGALTWSRCQHFFGCQYSDYIPLPARIH